MTREKYKPLSLEQQWELLNLVKAITEQHIPKKRRKLGELVRACDLFIMRETAPLTNAIGIANKTRQVLLRWYEKAQYSQTLTVPSDCTEAEQAWHYANETGQLDYGNNLVAVMERDYDELDDKPE